ncbi:MAG: efflux RND transporter periplasmic adaptor subunit [Deltaproteobacteria bacterium]|nr:efflux RND transporter periplasmic adaptor subunit [Deltaproteobacteria bacterium]
MIYKSFLKKATYLFIGMVLFFTFFSKTINNLNTPHVKTVKPQNGYLINKVRGKGRIVPETCNRLYLPSSLIIDKILVNPGDDIVYGTELFLINEKMINQAYNTEYSKYFKMKTELEQAEGELNKTDSTIYNIGEMEKQLKFAKEERESKTELYNSGFISKKELDQADIFLEKIQAEYLRSVNKIEDDKKSEVIRLKDVGSRIILLEMDINVLKKKVDILSELKNNPVYLSDQEGVILNIFCKEGEKITEEDPVVSILSDNNNFIFQAVIDTKQIEDVKSGDSATLYFGKNDFESQLDSIYSNSDGLTSTLKFTLDGNYIHGSETGYFILRQRSAFYDFIIPKRSVRGSGRNQFVYLSHEKNGSLSNSLTLKKAIIRVLDSSDNKVAVSGEITSDCKIVLDEDRTPLDENGRILVD